MSNPYIPIQSPHIDPPLFQRTAGEGAGLEPLIQALQQYKISKQQDTRNAIDAAQVSSEASLRGAQTDALRANLKRQDLEDEAWQKQIDTAPASFQPYLRALNGLRGLDPPLQQAGAMAIAQAIGHPGIQPAQIVAMQGYQRLGLDTESAARLAGVKVYDLADTKTPHDPDAIGLDRATLRWRYQPSTAGGRTSAAAARAQNEIVRSTTADDGLVRTTVQKQAQTIAEQAWRAAHGNAIPLAPIKFDANDPNQVRALHQFMQTNHLNERLTNNARNRAAAQARINATAGIGDTGDGSLQTGAPGFDDGGAAADSAANAAILGHVVGILKAKKGR